MDALPIFYCPAMAVPSGSASPNAEKPAAVVASWRRLGIPLTIIPPQPVTIAQLAMAHEEGFVRDILARRVPNGFGNRHRRVTPPRDASSRTRVPLGIEYSPTA